MIQEPITLTNVRQRLVNGGVIQKERLYFSKDKWKQYVLLNDVVIELSNGHLITIPKGFKWDLSSVPRMFWSILPPDGDFEIAALIHDFLYQHHRTHPYIYFKRSFADLEMFLWSKAANGTQKVSMKRIDNYTRYFGVRLFGWIVWD